LSHYGSYTRDNGKSFILYCEHRSDISSDLQEVLLKPEQKFYKRGPSLHVVLVKMLTACFNAQLTLTAILSLEAGRSMAGIPDVGCHKI